MTEAYSKLPGGEWEHLGSVSDVKITGETVPPQPLQTIGTGEMSFEVKAPAGTHKRMRRLYDSAMRKRDKVKNSYLRRLQRG